MDNEQKECDSDVFDLLILEVLKQNYEETGNPLFAWEALKYCFENNIDVLQWVSTYFVKTATDLLNLSKRELQTSEKASAEVYRALGMVRKGSSDIFDGYSLYLRDNKIIRRICELDLEENRNGEVLPTNVTKFVAKVAKEFNKSESAILKIWRKWAEPRGFIDEKKSKKYHK